jgi:MscS family membrane protein
LNRIDSIASKFVLTLAIFLLLCGPAIGQEPAPTPVVPPIVSEQVKEVPAEVPPEFASPAATLRTFMREMEASYPFSVSDTALDCMDLRRAPSLIKDTGGLQRAIKLYEVLVVARYDIQRVPTAPDGDPYVLYRQPSGDRIALARGKDGHWRFDPETIVAAVEMNEVLVTKGTLSHWIAPHFTRKILGLYLYQWALMLLPALLAYFLSRLLVWVIRFFVRRRHSNVDDWAPPGILRGFPWFVFAATFTGLLGFLDLSLKQLVLLTALGKFLAIVTLVWFCFGVIDVIQASILHSRVYKKVDLHNAIVPMTAKTVKALFAFLGVILLAQNLDINVWSLFAGFSVIGAMIALAGQDFVKNLFGSITVVLDQPFDIGDWIAVDGIDGTVEEVGFRSTRIRTFYNSLITLPNATLLTAKVDNYGARNYRRYRQLLHISQQTPQPLIESFCEAVRELVRQHPYTRKDYFHVYLNDVTPDALQILIYVFWETPDWATELAERHRLLSDVLAVAQRLGVELAPGTTRVQFTQWTPPESSDALYDHESFQLATEEGGRQARAVVNAAFPPDPPTEDSEDKES